MKPLLVHVHVYHTKLWAELKDLMRYLAPYPYDLYLTMVEAHAGIQKDAYELHPHPHIILLPNNGYDIAPFLHVLKLVDLSQYSYCIKLHTKRDMPPPWIDFCYPMGFRYWGAAWRKRLLAFMRKGNLEKCLSAFEKDPALGMACHRSLATYQEPMDYEAEKKCQEHLKNSGLNTNAYGYVKGSMFICRASLLCPTQQLNVYDKDFDGNQQSGNYGQTAHAIERFIGSSIIAQGYSIRDPFTLFPRLNALREKTVCLYWKIINSLRYRIINLFSRNTAPS